MKFVIFKPKVWNLKMKYDNKEYFITSVNRSEVVKLYIIMIYLIIMKVTDSCIIDKYTFNNGYSDSLYAKYMLTYKKESMFAMYKSIMLKIAKIILENRVKM